MGQYFKLINLDKKEQVIPWSIKCVAKFYEWVYGEHLKLLAYLLRKSDELGGGDIITDNLKELKYCGRWAGDRVLLIGDYDSSKLWSKTENYVDISKELKEEYDKVVERW